MSGSDNDCNDKRTPHINEAISFAIRANAAWAHGDILKVLKIAEERAAAG